MVKRKECWVPTFWGWLLLLVFLFVSLFLYAENIHSFLSSSEPIRAQILVIEEWIPVEALRTAASEFKSGGYSILLVAGATRGWVINILISEGVDRQYIFEIPVDRVIRDRTYTSALTVKKWLKNSEIYSNQLNVYTVGVHALRSGMLFRRALGPEFSVGVISWEDPTYDPDGWWASSEGFKKVIDETIAYFYTRLFLLRLSLET